MDIVQWLRACSCDRSKEAADEIERLTAERDALRLDAERYRWLRNRVPAEVLCNRGRDPGCWIDCEDEDGELMLLTGDDADAAIDAATLFGWR